MYLRDEVALRHGAGPEADTPHSKEAYAPFPPLAPGPTERGLAPLGSPGRSSRGHQANPAAGR